MRRVVSALVGATLVLSMIPVGAGAASPTPFSGTWTSIDAFDGSAQFLSIGKGASPVVVLIDTYASYCATHHASSTVFVGTGTGALSGSTALAVRVRTATCASFSVPLSILAGLRYTYSAGPNTLTDSFGVTWYAYPAPAAREVAGNVIARYHDNSSITAMLQMEVRTGPTGKVQYGFYRFEGMTPVLSRSQATIESIRFFTDASGAQAADFSGKECLLSPSVDPNLPTGACRWYHVVVTDGSRVGLPDTFCGGTDQGNPSACPFKFDVIGGAIRIR
jgi:hypothetical protein